jgi:hypothetical protein
MMHILVLADLGHRLSSPDPIPGDFDRGLARYFRQHRFERIPLRTFPDVRSGSTRFLVHEVLSELLIRDVSSTHLVNSWSRSPGQSGLGPVPWPGPKDPQLLPPCGLILLRFLLRTHNIQCRHHGTFLATLSHGPSGPETRLKSQFRYHAVSPTMSLPLS